MSTSYQRKRALIIGIDNYRGTPLKYCINDAKDLKTTLQSMKFDVSIGLNCDRIDFFNTIDTFVKGIQSTDLTLFYFAGHGKQMDGFNYLLPSDYDYNHRTSEQKYLSEYAVSVQYITKAIDDKNCRITIYIFDCCRQFIRVRADSMQQGLSAIYAPPETLIVFSCAPGKSASDETSNGRNGIFTGVLLNYIANAHEDIEEVIKNVARDVKNQTKGFQLPYRTSSLTDNVSLTNKNKQEDSTRMNSQSRLKCHGRACVTCGYCRDWYQCGIHAGGFFPDYRKRSDATCCSTQYVIHDGCRHIFNSLVNGFGADPVCECSDNI